MTKTVGIFNSREVDGATLTRVMAWLSRMESAFESHFGSLEGIPSHCLLHVAIQLLDDRAKTFVSWYVDVQTTRRDSFRCKLCKNFGLDECQVKTKLWRCHLGLY